MENNTAENEEENLVVEKKVADLFLYFLVDCTSLLLTEEEGEKDNDM